MSIFVKRSGRYLLQPFVLFLALTLLLSGCAAPGVSGNYIPFWHTLTGAKERALLELVDRWNANNPTGSVIVPERKDLVNLRGAISKLGSKRHAFAFACSIHPGGQLAAQRPAGPAG